MGLIARTQWSQGGASPEAGLRNHRFQRAYAGRHVARDMAGHGGYHAEIGSNSVPRGFSASSRSRPLLRDASGRWCNHETRHHDVEVTIREGKRIGAGCLECAVSEPGGLPVGVVDHLRRGVDPDHRSGRPHNSRQHPAQVTRPAVFRPEQRGQDAACTFASNAQAHTPSAPGHGGSSMEQPQGQARAGQECEASYRKGPI